MTLWHPLTMVCCDVEECGKRKYMGKEENGKEPVYWGLEPYTDKPISSIYSFTGYTESVNYSGMCGKFTIFFFFKLVAPAGIYLFFFEPSTSGLIIESLITWLRSSATHSIPAGNKHRNPNVRWPAPNRNHTWSIFLNRTYESCQ